MDKVTISTQIVNHFSDTAVLAAFGGAVGYICSRVVKQLDPRAALICGAVAGIVIGIFWSKGANLSSHCVSIFSLVVMPIKICNQLDLIISPLAAYSITAFVSALIFGIYKIQEDEVAKILSAED